MSLQRKIESGLMLLKKKRLISIPKVVDSSQLFEGKVALVIGGTGGIGAAISQMLVESGCKVIISGTTLNSFEKLEKNLRDDNNVKCLIFDVLNIDNYNFKLDEAKNLFGKIDILIYSAGVHSENYGYFDMKQSEFDRVMSINLKSPFFLCQKFAQYIVSEKSNAHICLVSSSRGSEPAYTPYGISKWGLNGMIKGVAQELIKHNIIVNGVAPGSTATPLIGVSKSDSIATYDNSVGRMATPEEVANIVKMLVGETGEMLAGEIVHISGGRGTFDIR